MTAGRPSRGARLRAIVARVGRRPRRGQRAAATMAALHHALWRNPAIVAGRAALFERCVPIPGGVELLFDVNDILEELVVLRMDHQQARAILDAPEPERVIFRLVEAVVRESLAGTVLPL